jgi:hypothetical protein
MMTRVSLSTLCLAVTVTLATTIAAGRADEPKAGNELVGTWKTVSVNYDGQEIERPGFTVVKHVTPTHFMWAAYDRDGKVVASIGGSYEIKGDDYIETPEYGLGEAIEGLKGKPQAFKWRVVGNKWHHSGQLTNKLTIQEVWERLEKK